MSIDDPVHVRQQYAHRGQPRDPPLGVAPDGRRARPDRREAARRRCVAEQPACPTCSRSGCGTGAFAARLAAALPGVALLAVDQSARFVELTRARGVDARRCRTSSTCRRRRGVRRGARRSGCSTTCPTSTAASPRYAGCCGPAAGSWPSPTATSTSPTCAARPAAARCVTDVQQRERRGGAAAALRRCPAHGPRRPAPSSPTARPPLAYLGSSDEDDRLAAASRTAGRASTPAR